MPSKLFTYDDIENIQIRTYNRCAMWVRAGAAGGSAGQQEYMSKLDDIGRQQVIEMLRSIRDEGYTTVRKKVLETL